MILITIFIDILLISSVTLLSSVKSIKKRQTEEHEHHHHKHPEEESAAPSAMGPSAQATSASGKIFTTYYNECKKSTYSI